MKRQVTEKLLDQFRSFLKNDERSAATIEKYMRDLNCFAKFVGNGDISKEDIINYKNSLPQKYALSSANSMLAALNSFLRFCGWQDLCVKQFRIQREAYCPEDKELTKEEYMRLLCAANKNKNERLNLIIQTICGTGIRVSELQYITVEAVNKGEAAVSCKGKNRRIFIVSDLKKKLLRYAKEQNIISGPVFLTRRGKPVSRVNIWRDMKALCEQAQVCPSKVFPHNLRHLFARTFYRLEKDIAKLADILGHTNINTTRVYIVTTCAEHKRRMEHMHLII